MVIYLKQKKLTNFAVAKVSDSYIENGIEMTKKDKICQFSYKTQWSGVFQINDFIREQQQ